MRARLPQLVFGAITIAALALATQAGAGGAWPRGAGKVFASLSYSTFGDAVTYLERTYSQIPGLEPPPLTEETGLFLEFGMTDRVTMGLDRTSRNAEDVLSSVWFLRRNFSRPGWKSSYGLELGFGPFRDWRQINDTQFRLGASWGRGFESRWVDGWVDVDAKVAGLERSGSVYWKVDTTFGIKPGERSLIYLQMQTGAIDGAPTYTRAQPTYVLRLGRGLSLETALLLGLENDDSQGMKLAAWLEF